MFENILFLVLGLVLLVKGADYFVEFTARIANKLGVSAFIIGLTLTAIGTSIPELAASVSAALQGHTGLILGNVIGSNIANIGLIIGIAAVIHSFKTDRKMFMRDGYILILTVIVFYAVASDGIISITDGIALLVLYFVYIMFLIKTHSTDSENYTFHHFLDYFFKFEYLTTIKSNVMKRALRKKTKKEMQTLQLFEEGIIKDVIISILALTAVIIGAKYFVQESAWLANLLGIPDSLIGLSIVAIGTSLPELVVSISAVRKGLSEIVLGNVIGSNIANVLLIIGVSSLIAPLQVSKLSIIYLIPIMGFFTLLLIYFIRSDWSIGRNSGILALLLYIIFMAAAFFFGWS
jgi:cation:H+ antiporter